MKITVFILLILLGITVGLWFSYVRIEMVYKREQGNDRGEVMFKALGGLLRFRVNIPKVDWEGTEQGIHVESRSGTKAINKQEELQIDQRKVRKAKKMYEMVLQRIDDLKEIMRQFLSKVTCEQLIWGTTVGTGDASEAGILTGVIWGVKTTLVGFFSGYIRWKEPPQLIVDPVFTYPIIRTHFHGIFRFRLGHAILGITRMILHLRRGRERNWQSSTPFRA
ncbi:DUF2953 domain-containing protein [Hazenella coriacea]|uniref:DUF2953 family protein n=1 Tax=Hazenella coriacea TaxID=1179467 RepID=A0A4R3L1K0_9BACL|nr:DUF2953 domain-containing protein [Hazenella coriacea]TCS93451.1 DUF2953 family protein [Hazenella coriacea]